MSGHRTKDRKGGNYMEDTMTQNYNSEKQGLGIGDIRR